jgi:hypothetical protein
MIDQENHLPLEPLVTDSGESAQDLEDDKFSDNLKSLLKYWKRGEKVKHSRIQI